MGKQQMHIGALLIKPLEQAQQHCNILGGRGMCPNQLAPWAVGAGRVFAGPCPAWQASIRRKAHCACHVSGPAPVLTPQGAAGPSDCHATRGWRPQRHLPVGVGY